MPYYAAGFWMIRAVLAIEVIITGGICLPSSVLCHQKPGMANI